MNGLSFDFGGEVVCGRLEAGHDALAVPAIAPLFAIALLFLAPLCVRGPLYFWYEFWTQASFRTIFTWVFVFKSLWLLFAIASCGARTVRGASLGTEAADALGAAGAGLGAALACLGLLLGLPGLENSLTAVNNEMAVLPLGLSESSASQLTLTYPVSLPLWLVIFGAAMIVPAEILPVRTNRRKDRAG